MSPDHSRSLTPAKVRSICHWLGLSILVVGLASAACIWQIHPAPTPENDLLRGMLSADESAKYQRQVEIYYGKSGQLMDRWSRMAAELSHGKPLAETIAIVSIVGAGCCFTVAALLKRIEYFPPLPR